LDLLLETHDLLLKNLEALLLLLNQGAEGGLGSSGDLLPEFGEDWRLRRHAAELRTGPPKG
jgi:hypothetical protein